MATAYGESESVMIEGWLSRHRFVWLLFVLLGFLFFVSFSQQIREAIAPEFPPILEVSALVIIMTMVIASITRSRTWQVYTAAMGIAAAVLWVVPVSGPDDWMRLVRHLLAMAFLGYGILSILRRIFGTRRVTFNLLCASLCIYLLFGVMWALTYSLMCILNPDAFFSSESGSAAAFSLAMDAGKSAEALYFSLATLTTLGYGDIVPNSHASRMVTVLEAVVGQLYLTVLVARLVGLHIADSQFANSPRRANDI